MSGSLLAMVIFMAWQNAITEIPESENSCRSGGKRCTTCRLRDSSPNAIKADSTKRLQSRLNQTPSKQTQPNAIKADSTKRHQSRHPRPSQGSPHTPGTAFRHLPPGRKDVVNRCLECGQPPAPFPHRHPQAQQKIESISVIPAF